MRDDSEVSFVIPHDRAIVMYVGETLMAQNLYCLAELAQIIIKNRAQQHGWPLSSYPGKIRLPRDGFLNLHDPKQVSDNVRRTYLKEEVNGWVKMLGKRGAVAAPPVSVLYQLFSPNFGDSQ